MASQKTVHKKATLDEALKSRAKIPASWERAFGILRNHKPSAHAQLKKMRQKDEARSRALQRRIGK
ncbi:MAG TPA: hypothetical protein VJK53_02150 [Candidatus Paceibacterota bacterium]